MIFWEIKNSINYIEHKKKKPTKIQGFIFIVILRPLQFYNVFWGRGDGDYFLNPFWESVLASCHHCNKFLQI